MKGSFPNRPDWRSGTRSGSHATTWGREGDYEDEDPEDIEMDREAGIRRCAADLLAVERAGKWLFEDEEA